MLISFSCCDKILQLKSNLRKKGWLLTYTFRWIQPLMAGKAWQQTGKARAGGWLDTWHQDSESREQERSGMGDKDSRSALSDSFPAKKLHILKVPKPSSPTTSWHFTFKPQEWRKNNLRRLTVYESINIKPYLHVCMCLQVFMHAMSQHVQGGQRAICGSCVLSFYHVVVSGFRWHHWSSQQAFLLTEPSHQFKFTSFNHLNFYFEWIKFF